MFYVYLLRRPDKEDPFEPGKGQPFYVGKGSNGRAKGHRKEAHTLLHKPGRKTFKIQIIHKLWAAGLDYEEEIILSGCTEEEAFLHECQTISAYGRINNGIGCLTNLTDGGDGASGFIHSQDFKEKRSKEWMGNTLFLGRKHSQETREKMSVINKGANNKQYGKTPWNKGKTPSDETKQKIRDKLIGKPMREEVKRKISESNKGHIGWTKGVIGVYHHSEKVRQKLSESKKGENNPSFKPEKITLIHKDGKVKTYNRQEWEKIEGLWHAAIPRLLNGKVKTAMGWSLYDSK